MEKEIKELIEEYAIELTNANFMERKILLKEFTLKLINSNESNEFRTVGNNEQDGSICPDCKGDGATYITQFIQPICKKCNGTGQI